MKKLIKLKNIYSNIHTEELTTKLQEFGVEFFRLAEVATDMKLNKIKPEPGDIVHSRYEDDITGDRLSIEVIKDILTKV